MAAGVCCFKDKTVRVWRRSHSSGQYEEIASGRGHTMSVTAVAWAKYVY